MIIDSHIVSSTDYYNEVAPCYNSQQTGSDDIVREQVRKIFRSRVPTGDVLDLGGGTGLDLGWLTTGGYHVFFVEPSVNMRSLAMQMQVFREENAPLSFIEENTNVYEWSPDHLPFQEKMDGVLLNFAVLNSIKDPDLFFEKIRTVCKPGCFLIMTVISGRLGIILKRYGTSHFIKHIVKGSFISYTHYNGLIHETFIYSPRRIKKSSGSYFHFLSCTPIPFSGFDLVILSAK